jgi:hypothetical protein
MPVADNATVASVKNDGQQEGGEHDDLLKTTSS